MRAVIQRTKSEAYVAVDAKKVGQIDKGLIVYLGIGINDTKDDIDWLANKIVNLRIFSDQNGKMNLSLIDIEGQILLISQFTLFGQVKKGNRPSYIKSADPDKANKMYEKFADVLINNHKIKTEKGIFAADMKVSYINDGPVTIIIDSKQKSF